MARPAENDREIKWSNKHQAWKAFVKFDNGRYRRVEVKGLENQAEAQKKLDALLLERQLSDTPKPKPTALTYSQVIDAWFAAGCPNGGLDKAETSGGHETVKDDNTKDQVESLLRNHVKEFSAPGTGRMGNRIVNRDKKKDVKEHFIAVDQRRRLNARDDAPYEEARIASSTVYRIWWHLANAVEWSKNDEDMGVLHNPCLGVKLPPKRETKDRRAFQRAELPAIFATILNDQRKAMWMTFLMTGARPGEVIGLRWPWVDIDSDLQKCGIWIEERAEHRGSKYIGQADPKAKSKRAMVIHPRLVQALREHREELESLGLYHPEGFVFPTNTGRPVGYSSIRKWLDKMMESVQLGDWMPYELRHSFVSLTYDEVQDLRVVADLAGHKDTKTTLFYRHRVRELDPRGAQAWDGLLSTMEEYDLDPDLSADFNPSDPDPEPELPDTPPGLRLLTSLEYEAPKKVAFNATIAFKDAWPRIKGLNAYVADKMRKEGTFPIPVVMLYGSYRVEETELDAWIAEHPEGIQRPKKEKATHCKWGHELTEDNLYLNSTNGVTSCRTCRRVSQRQSRLLGS